MPPWHVGTATHIAEIFRDFLYSQRPMEQFIKHFKRERAGDWICMEPATLDLPQGRVQVTPGSRFLIGTKFMNVDLARLLDQEYSRQQRPSG